MPNTLSPSMSGISYIETQHFALGTSMSGISYIETQHFTLGTHWTKKIDGENKHILQEFKALYLKQCYNYREEAHECSSKNQ